MVYVGWMGWMDGYLRSWVFFGANDIKQRKRREKEEKKKGKRREKGQISFHVSRLCTLQTSVVSCCNKNQNIVVVFAAPARHTLNIFFYMLLSYIFLLY